MDVVTYAMSDVLVTSARHGDTAAGLPFDRFTLGFRTLTITYRPQAPNGAGRAGDQRDHHARERSRVTPFHPAATPRW